MCAGSDLRRRLLPRYRGRRVTLEGEFNGREVGEALVGAWRPSPPELVLSPAGLAAVAPVLMMNGAGGLAWWRLRHSQLRASAPGRELRQAYRLQALQAVEHEGHLRQAVSLLRSADIEPVLIKGWAAARLYPETGLRPYGDLDLCVHPDRLSQAMEVLSRTPGQCAAVELHEGIPDVSDRTWEEMYRRSRLVPLVAETVRVLGPEDQLRQLCLHFWRHHACRPLWLCDIAAALEAASADFDWDYCLSGDRLLVDWTVTLCALACRLLDARCGHAAVADRVARLPAWLVRAVLWKWGVAQNFLSFSHCLRHWDDALQHWFDPIKTSYRLRLTPRTPGALLFPMSLLGRLAWLPARVQRRWRKRQAGLVQPVALHLQGESRFL